MPSLSVDFLKSLQTDYRQYPCFIETGTLNGNTTFAMEPLFDSLYTIEYSEKYYTNTKNRYKGNKIQFLHGDSSEVFKALLPTIQDKAIFFLDGHWSGSDTGHSAKDCPLEEELQCIQTLFKQKAVVIIDDYRLFGLDKSSDKLGEDWSQISKSRLLSIVSSRLDVVYHLDSSLAKDDRLILHLNANS